jgi:DivIVA domain-containing protein
MRVNMDADDPEERIAELERRLAEHAPVTQPHQASDEADRPMRWLLTPMPSLRQSVKPRPAVVMDVGKDAIWVTNPETNTLIASAWLAQVVATPAEFLSSQGDAWVRNVEYIQPLLVVDVPGTQSLIIGTPAMKGSYPLRFRFSWRGGAYPGKNPNYYLRDPDWFALVEKFGLAEHLDDDDPAADQSYPSASPAATGGSLTLEQVRDITFAAAPLTKRGYDEAEVDAFLDVVVAALKDPGAHRLTPEQVRGVSFSPSPIGKRGYKQEEVDAFLHLVETHTNSGQGTVAAPATGARSRHARPESRTGRAAKDTGRVLGGIAGFLWESFTGPD